MRKAARQRSTAWEHPRPCLPEPDCRTPALLCAAGPALKMLPTAASVGLLMVTLKRVRHPAALPATLVAINLAFYGVLLAGGWTLEQAQVLLGGEGDGWVFLTHRAQRLGHALTQIHAA